MKGKTLDGFSSGPHRWPTSLDKLQCTRAIATGLIFLFLIAPGAKAQAVSATAVGRPGRLRFGTASGSTHAAHAGATFAVLVGALVINRFIENRHRSDKLDKNEHTALSSGAMFPVPLSAPGRFTVRDRTRFLNGEHVPELSATGGLWLASRSIRIAPINQPESLARAFGRTLFPCITPGTQPRTHPPQPQVQTSPSGK